MFSGCIDYAGPHGLADIVANSRGQVADGGEDGEAGEPKVDTNNPDPALQSRPIMGLELMKNFKFVGKGAWKKGTIYDPDNGKTYKCKLRLGDDGVLNVRGYIGISMIGRTSHWTRVESED